MASLFSKESSTELKKYERIITEMEKYGYSGRRHPVNSVINSSVINENTDLHAETMKLKKYVAGNPSKLENILPRACAVICEAARRHGKRPYPVQILGALALHYGNIAEMKTGEGKTITAVVAAYINALTGKGVHITTSNDYLAKEAGYKKMGPIFEEAGLTVGVVTNNNDRSKKSLEQRRHAYNCDVTYGSSDAFAFDYLFDNIAKSPSRTVLRKDKVGFVIIDEADQILVNNATTPFRLSGDINAHLANNKKEVLEANELMAQWKKQQMENLQKADAFVYHLFSNKSECLEIPTKEEFDEISIPDKRLNINHSLYSVIYSKANGVTLTEKGLLLEFYYFNRDKINNVINQEKLKQAIIKSKSFQEGNNQDYIIDNRGNITLNPRGLERAIRIIPSINKLNQEFIEEAQKTGFDHYINNALTAYFVRTNQNDYTIQDHVDEKGNIKKKVSLIQDGRTQEGRVYSLGLQQAIELKERRLNPGLAIELSKDSDELASITQRAFYNTYSKVSGMTGTSARKIFDSIYGMETLEIPRNSTYELTPKEQAILARTRIDKPDVVFATEEEKLMAVIKSIEDSYHKGQPVLIGTFSDEESLKLYREIRKRGLPCEFLNTENSYREAEIISKAGIKGAITISTQMAGRGTDIQLGGDPELIIKEQMRIKAEKMAALYLKDKTYSKEIKDKYVQSALSYLEKNRDDFIKREGLTKEYFASRKNELVKVGGLKVIGYGHYPTKRNDDQLRGRAARQNDPGVTEFYSSIKEDLEQKLNIPSYITSKLLKKGLKKGHPISGAEISKIIASGQELIESSFEDILYNTQEQDYLISNLRTKIYDQRKRILYGDENIEDHMEYIIESSVENLINRHVAKDNYNLSPRKKIKESNFNKGDFIKDVGDILGLDIKYYFDNDQFQTFGDLENYLKKASLNKYHRLRRENGDIIQDTNDKLEVLSTLDRAWSMFQDRIEDVNIQKNLYAMAQNEKFDEKYEIKKTYNASLCDSKLETVKRMFGKQLTIEQQLDQEKAKKTMDNTNSYYVFDNQKKKNNKLQVRLSKIAAVFSNRYRLAKVNKELKTYIEEETLKNSHKK